MTRPDVNRGDRPLDRSDLFVGLRLRATYRVFGSQIMIVLGTTEKGFQYVWAERQHLGTRLGYSDYGECYAPFDGIEIADKDQARP